VTRPISAFAAALVLAGAISAAGVAQAAPDDATLNSCWGQTTKEFTPLGDHASDPPGVEPGEGREGVGNVSKDFGELSEGAQGKHANAVAPDDLEECEGPPVP
jgi:hypothetical protein